MALGALACGDVEAEYHQRSEGFGAPCAVGSQCPNGLICHFGYCPLVDAGPLDAGEADAGEVIPNVCGDGLVGAEEACDDGNDADDDACTTTCQPARCGDGIVRRDASPRDPGYEICDDGNDSDTDACTNACAPATCGDGILRDDLEASDRRFEACDDGNQDNDDACVEGCQLARCGDGYLQAGVELCEPGGALGARCGDDCQLVGGGPSGDGSSPDRAAKDCELIKLLQGDRRDGLYYLDTDGEGPAEPAQIHCDMNFEGGGWTRAMAMRRGDVMWEAWTTRSGNSAEGILYGLPLQDFSADGTGEDIEFFLRIDGVFKGRIYTGVRALAWDPFMGPTPYDDAMRSRLPGAEYEDCVANLVHANGFWNWAVSSGGGGGCVGYAAGGFIVHGSRGRQDHADVLYGLGEYRGYASFSTIEVFVR